MEEGAVARVYGDDLEGHAGFLMSAADDGAATNLTRRRIQQKLHGAAKRQGPRCADKEAAESKAVQVRDVAGHAGLPGDEEGIRRLDPRIFALVRSEHGRTTGFA